MPVQFKIVITKAIIAQCKYCGSGCTDDSIEENCAIAMALSPIFPDVYITDTDIYPLGINNEQAIKVQLPAIARQFVKLFDGFSLTPKLRLLLPQFEFTIDIPDELIEQINIDEVKELIEKRENTAVIL